MKHLPILLLASFIATASAGQSMQQPVKKQPGKQQAAKQQPAKKQAVKTPFTGFSVIAEAGGIAGKADLKQDVLGRITASTPIKYSNEARIPESGATGAVGLEYAHQFQNGVVFAGLVTAGFNYLTFEGEANATTGVGGLFGFTQGKLTTELRNDVALLFKPGFAFHNTLVYGLVGPRWGNFKSTFDNEFIITETGQVAPLVSLPSHADQSAYHMGLAVGAGLSQKLWSHVVAGVEYQYTAYGNDIASFHSAFLNTAGYVANASVERVSTNTLMATVAYQF